MIRQPPRSTLFPHPTLSRSETSTTPSPASASSAMRRWISALAPTSTPRVDVDRKSTRLNSSHGYISYAVFCLKKKKRQKLNHSDDRDCTHTRLTAAYRQT